MNLTPEEREWLQAQPDYLEIDFMGRARPWILSDEALRLAEGEGIALGTVLGARLATTDDDAGAFRAILETVTARLYAGFKVFDPELTIEKVRLGVTARTANAFLRLTNGALYGDAGEDAPAVEVEATASHPTPSDDTAIPETEGNASAPATAP